MSKYLSSPVLHGWILGPIVFLLGLGIYSAYKTIGHALDYTEVPATVTGVEAICAPADPDAVVRWRSCEKLGDAPERELRDRHMLRQYRVAVSFRSPADGKTHQGVFKDFGRGGDGTSLVRPGQTGLICADDHDPSRYHYDEWPFPARATSPAR
jgi:hypothetical protein